MCYATSMTKDITSKNDKVKFKVRHEPDPEVDPREYTDAVDRALVKLLMNEPFFGAISMSIVKRADWTCDTAYVGATQNCDIILGYNPDFMRNLNTDEKIGVFIHEFYHLIFNHITERSNRNPKFASLWNVATDLSINSLIKRSMLPDFALVPGEHPKYCEDQDLSDLIASFRKEEAADWYMARLTEFAESKGNKDGDGNYTIMIGDGTGESMDGHGEWGKLPEELQDVLRETTKEIIGKAVNNARCNSWGSVPSGMQGLIEKMLVREIDWKAVLRMFVGRVRSSERESTMKRFNKKNTVIMENNDGLWAFPGAKRILHSKLLFAIDQSGSMADEDVQMGLAEGLSCSMEGEIDIINFDTEVDPDSFRTVKRGKGFKWERTRCGGTDFDCVRRFVARPENKGKWQGIVVVTDGYAPTMGSSPGVKFLWLITPTGSMESVRGGDLVVQMKKEKTFHKK